MIMTVQSTVEGETTRGRKRLIMVIKKLRNRNGTIKLETTEAL